jgi:Flp pilus assembly protein TadG
MRLLAQTSPRAHRGVAAVEFAVALPLLLFLMMATAELGRFMSQYDTLTKAVRDGARYLAGNALANSTSGVVNVTAALQAATKNLVATGNVNGSGSALLPGLAAGNVTAVDLGNGYISVAVSYTYQPMLAPLPTFGLTSPIALAVPMKTTVVMRPL